MQFPRIECGDGDNGAEVRPSTMAAAVRKMRNSTGTRSPSMTTSATAKAVSVDIGTPQPNDQGPGGTMRR